MSDVLHVEDWLNNQGGAQYRVKLDMYRQPIAVRLVDYRIFHINGAACYSGSWYIIQSFCEDFIHVYLGGIQRLVEINDLL